MVSVPSHRRELIAWVLAVAVGAALVVSLRSGPADAGAIVATGPTTRVVYIATGENYPDALAAASAAGIDLGPVLLVQQNSLPAATLAELNRLEPRQVIITGGTTVVSQAVADQIDALAFNPVVTRIAGGNRYETAADLSAATFPTTGYYPRAAYSVSDNLPDLAGGAATNVLGVEIVAPTNGILVIDAGADTRYDSGAAIVSCWITLDSVAVEGSLRFVDLDSTVTEQNCSTETAITVDAGTYDVVFRINQDAAIDTGEGALTAMWIPFTGDGAIPEP